MARRPNYSFERAQRDRAKAAKREAKRAARAARRGGERAEDAEGGGEAPVQAPGAASASPELAERGATARSTPPDGVR